MRKVERGKERVRREREKGGERSRGRGKKRNETVER